MLLKGVAADHPHPVIGIFDYDPEGLKAFSLDKNFVEIQLDGQDVKRGMHGRSYAACLPAPDFRTDCKEHQNLSIEFMFRDEHLSTEVDGKKLTLKRMKTSRMVGNKKVEQELPDLTHFKEVGSGKTDFADVVVPTLDAGAFDAFDAVFSMIEAMIAHNQQGA